MKRLESLSADDPYPIDALIALVEHLRVEVEELQLEVQQLRQQAGGGWMSDRQGLYRNTVGPGGVTYRERKPS